MSTLGYENDPGLERTEAARRLEGRVALVVGAGQQPGITIGNGKATSLVFAKEGASVFAVDINADAAEDTATTIRASGGVAESFVADVNDEASIAAMVERCLERFGQIDILQNNVGVGTAAGDTSVLDITPEVFNAVTATNLTGMVLTAKHVLPSMRRRASGVITNISSFVAYSNTSPRIAYKTSKAGVIALTENLAITNAEFNIRANVIIPGMMHTPLALEPRIAQSGETREAVIAERDAQVPLGRRMGTAWDIAYASLFLASDEARFISGASLVVDGAQSLKIG